MIRMYMFLGPRKVFGSSSQVEVPTLWGYFKNPLRQKRIQNRQIVL